MDCFAYFWALMPRVSIVILNWNGLYYLQRFLPSVLATQYDNLEIVLADNASTDTSVGFVQENFPSVTIIRLEKNLGFAGGYNEALKQVEADYFVLLNSDVAVSAGWVQPVIELMEADKSIGAVQPKILMETQRNRFEYAGASGGWIDALGYPFARGRVFDDCEEDQGQYNDAQPVFWASGAAMFVRAAIFRSCGGFDAGFFAHMEEIDLCWRMQRAGYKMMVCPQSVVYHVGGGTLPKGNERKVFLNYRNNLVMLSKNMPVLDLCWKLPVRFGLDALSAWKGLLAGDAVYFWAVLKAHLAFVRWLLAGPKEKGAVRSPRKVSLTGYYAGSVVWAYFVRKRRKFSEIVLHKPV